METIYEGVCTMDKSNLIGTLCWFWDDEVEGKVIGILDSIQQEKHNGKTYTSYHIKDDGAFDFDGFDNCEPVKRSEVRFAE